MGSPSKTLSTLSGALLLTPLGDALCGFSEYPVADRVVLRDGSRAVVLLQDWSFMCDGFEVRVGAGFVYDDASTPRLLWALISPSDCGEAAPLAHDFLYRIQGVMEYGIRFDRERCDRLFLSFMERERVVWWRRWAAYAAVRIAGGVAWKKAGRRGL